MKEKRILQRTLMRAVTTALLLALLGVAAPAGAATNEVDYDCIPTEVAVFSNRVHMRCQNPYFIFIWYFALPITDPQADRLMTLASTAMSMGGRVSVHFDGLDQSGTSFGCGANDCRKPMWFFLRR